MQIAVELDVSLVALTLSCLLDDLRRIVLSLQQALDAVVLHRVR